MMCSTRTALTAETQSAPATGVVDPTAPPAAVSPVSAGTQGLCWLAGFIYKIVALAYIYNFSQYVRL